jgi:hypothetical protein
LHLAQVAPPDLHLMKGRLQRADPVGTLFQAAAPRIPLPAILGAEIERFRRRIWSPAMSGCHRRGSGVVHRPG